MNSCLIYVQCAGKRWASLSSHIWPDKSLKGQTNEVVDALCATWPTDSLLPILEIQRFFSSSLKLCKPRPKKTVRFSVQCVCWALFCQLLSVGHHDLEVYPAPWPMHIMIIVRRWLRKAKEIYLWEKGEDHKWCQAPADSVHHHTGQVSYHHLSW